MDPRLSTLISMPNASALAARIMTSSRGLLDRCVIARAAPRSSPIQHAERANGDTTPPKYPARR